MTDWQRIQALAKETLPALLTRLSPTETRERCLDALRRWWRERRPTDETSFSFSAHLGRQLVGMLNDGAPSDPLVIQMAELFVHDHHKPYLQDVHDAIWWFVQAGFASPHGPATGDGPPPKYRLTRRGIAFLENDDDHPLLPGFLERVTDKCPGLPVGVTALLTDARRCLDHGLLRPSVMVLGLAYEVAIQVIADNLETKNLVPQNTRTAMVGEKIRRMRAAMQQQAMTTFVSDRETRDAISAAIEFADDLRDQRNQAAHTTIEFDSKGETEEFIVSAGRHLVSLWILANA